MIDGSLIRTASPFMLGMVVGGAIWAVFDSVFLGLLAAAATGWLVNRDRADDGEGEP